MSNCSYFPYYIFSISTSLHSLFTDNGNKLQSSISIEGEGKKQRVKNFQLLQQLFSTSSFSYFYFYFSKVSETIVHEWKSKSFFFFLFLTATDLCKRISFDLIVAFMPFYSWGSFRMCITFNLCSNRKKKVESTFMFFSVYTKKNRNQNRERALKSISWIEHNTHIVINIRVGTVIQ